MMPKEALSYEEYRRQRLQKGGEGSGNFAHAGRPGQIGGSAPAGISHYPGEHWVKIIPSLQKIMPFVLAKYPQLQKTGMTTENALTLAMIGEAIKDHPMHGEKIPNVVHETTNRLAKEIVNLPTETVYVLDKSGQILEKAIGSRSEATLQKSPPRNAFLLHNHPSPSSFSTQDVDMAMYNDLKNSRVAGGNFLYEIARPTDGWPRQHVKPFLIDKQFFEIYDKYDDRLLKFIRSGALGDTGWLTPKKISAMMTHAIWMILGPRLKIPYRRYALR